MSCTAEDFVYTAKKFLGYNEWDNSYLQILDIYNKYTPLARGYKMRPSDSWCACFVSAIAIKCNAVDIVGTEVSCDRFRDIFIKKGIWESNNTITPKPGDIVIYTWDKYQSPKNDGFPCHIGIIEKCEDKLVTAIEGNYSDSVARRQYAVGWGYVVGYARPRFIVLPAQTDEEYEAGIRRVAMEVIRGRYGNGADRIANLEKAGYNYDEVQAMVNRILKGE